MKLRTIIYALIAIALVIGAGYTLKKNKEKTAADTAIVAQQSNEINVNIQEADFEHISADYSSNGTFAPFQQLNFPSEISGRIVKIFVDEGSYVRAGQVVATIKKDQLEVDNSNALANYQNARADYQRYENAFKTGGVTKQQVDMAALKMKNAKAQLEQANLKIGDTNVRASISGVINKKYIEPGSVVAAGTQLFEIVNVSKLKLKVNVNESEVANLRLGDIINVKASVYPDKIFRGKVTFIAPLADASLNFPVEIEIENNPGNDLRAGMYGTAVFSSKESGTSHSLLVISKDAFVNGISSGKVFTVENGNIAKLKKIVTGRVFGNKVEILDGLKKGEKVITSGQINVADGTKVKIIK